MAYFAELGPNNTVLRVIVADQKFIDTGAVGNPQTWIETSLDGSAARKNYAGKGYIYDSKLDAFVAPKPFPSWLLDAATAKHVPPKAFPTGAHSIFFRWDEQKGDFADVTIDDTQGLAL